MPPIFGCQGPQSATKSDAPNRPWPLQDIETVYGLGSGRNSRGHPPTSGSGRCALAGTMAANGRVRRPQNKTTPGNPGRCVDVSGLRPDRI